MNKKKEGKGLGYEDLGNYIGVIGERVEVVVDLIEREEQLCERK